MVALEIVSETQNKLYDRKEVKAKFTHISATPSRKEVVEALAEKFGHKDSIVIDKVTQHFGRKEAEVSAKIYDRLEDAQKLEPSYRFDRTSGKKEEKKDGGEKK